MLYLLNGTFPKTGTVQPMLKRVKGTGTDVYLKCLPKKEILRTQLKYIFWVFRLFFQVILKCNAAA